MGFYGNITNTSRTQFQFDKIYPSRAEMDAGTYTDGIYAGRYVLVEYDSDVHQSSFYQVWIKDNDEDKGMYGSPNFEEETAIWINSKPNERKGTVLLTGAIVFTAKVDKENNKYTDTVYYQITGSSGLLIKEQYKQVTSDKTLLPDGTESTVANYIKNYAIDNEVYQASRGYDSTVWQKTYIDNVEKYIMIAELNSVVPTFDVSADAPTVEPITPHFDTQSTDLYYKLHWQSAWGMRVAEGKLPNDVESGGITSSKDPEHGKYPSDEEVSYSKVKYNSDTKEVEEDEQSKISYNGAIYYNKAGFEDNRHTYYNGSFEDKISVKPTGISGTLYNQHGNSIELTAQPDIQEISIMLPSLGNALCDIWDKVYGYDPENQNNRYRDIGWKDAKDINVNFAGKPVPDKGAQGDGSLGGMTRKSETLAGCINMAHDLMGMIITTSIPNVLGEDEYQKHLIYYKDKKYYRIYKYPKYKVLDNINDATEVYLVDEELENNEWKVRKYNKRASVPNGKKLAIKDTTDPFGYKLVEIEDFAGNLNTINGLIVSIRNILESDNSETRNKQTVQGTINVLNDIIDCFNDLIPGEFLICNNDGKVNSAGWTTNQAIKYENLGDGSSTEKSEGENQWINLSINADANKEEITLKHQLAHSRTNTITNSNKNNTQYGEEVTYPNNIDETGKKLFTGINNDNNINTLKLYTPIVDNAGHVVGKNTETVTLPFGYKYLKTNGRVDEEQRDLYTNIKIDPEGNIIGYEDEKKIVEDTEKNAQAENTQDQIIINPKNKWIQTQITTPDNGSDTITIAHEVHSVDNKAITNETNLNKLTDEEIKAGQNPNKIKIQDMSFDAAGHITANKAHTYILPYGYQIIKTGNDTIANPIANPDVVVDGQIASNTQDTITIKGGNHWIKIGNNNKVINICHDASDKTTKNQTITTGANSTTTKKQIKNTEGGIEEITENTPKFGETFDVPQISYDKAGHISEDNKYSIKLPAPSLVTAKKSDETEEKLTGNVLIDLSLNPTEGIFTKKPAYVGNLTLTGYSKATSKEAIGDTDSINQAFGKLQFRIEDTDNLLDTEVTERKKAIAEERTDRNQAIKTAIQALNNNNNTFDSSKTISSWEINKNGQAVIGLADIRINISQVTDLTTKLENINTTLGKKVDESALTTTKNELLGTKPSDDTGSQPTLYSLLAEINALKTEIGNLKKVITP